MQAFLKAIALEPRLDRAWYGLGLSLAHDGRHEEAVVKFKEAARIQPLNPYAGYHLAASLYRLGRREELQAEYERVKEFDPKISDQIRREFGVH
jgi:tetratricopeptide (TPR) repeat protein